MRKRTVKGCSWLFCERKAMSRGMCSRHYQVMRRMVLEEHGEALPAKPVVELKKCEVEFCTMRTRSGTRCRYHAARPHVTAQCRAPGCRRDVHRIGFCWQHFQVWAGAKEEADPGIEPKRFCSVQGCDRQHAARGYCAFHYQRWKRTPEKPINRAAWSQATETCRNCDHAPLFDGLCRACYEKEQTECTTSHETTNSSETPSETAEAKTPAGHTPHNGASGKNGPMDAPATPQTSASSWPAEPKPDEWLP